MCIFCRMKEAMEEEQREQLAEAGAPGQTEGPTNPVVYPSDEQAQVDLNHTKALVNSANADAIFKLAQAAKWLYDSNFQKEADLVAKQLVSLLPVSANKAKEPVADKPAATEEALPPELAELISKMRAAGFEVDAVRIPL